MQIRHLVRIAISLVLFLVFVAYVSGVLPFRFLDQLEHYAYDARIRLTMPGTVDHRIVIVDIDDATLREKGWPLSRDLYARMIDQLFDTYHVKLVVFDVEFVDPDPGRELSLLKQLQNGPLKDDKAFITTADKLRPGLEHDSIFARSLEHRPVILGYVFDTNPVNANTRSQGQLPVPIVSDVAHLYPNLGFPGATSYTSNLPLYAQAAAGQGYFSNPNDDDGSFRRVWLVREYNGDLYASLELAALSILNDQAPLKFVFDTSDPHKYDNSHLDAFSIGNATIPVDENMTALVPYRGPAHSFPYVSALKVMDGNADAATLNNAIIYVGTSVAGLQDLRTTPVGSIYPGVEVHANLLSGILDNRVMSAQPQYGKGALIVLLLIVAVIITWLSIRASIIINSLAALGLFVAIVA
ncbi:MAG: CHASE2 domain-containing protein, partial [Gammaproteobacteria bacterium]